MDADNNIKRPLPRNASALLRNASALLLDGWIYAGPFDDKARGRWR